MFEMEDDHVQLQDLLGTTLVGTAVGADVGMFVVVETTWGDAGNVSPVSPEV